MRNAMWASNPSGEPGDAGADVRAMREHDQRQVAVPVVAGADDYRSDDEVSADLLALVDLAAQSPTVRRRRTRRPDYDATADVGAMRDEDTRIADRNAAHRAAEAASMSDQELAPRQDELLAAVGLSPRASR